MIVAMSEGELIQLYRSHSLREVDIVGARGAEHMITAASADVKQSHLYPHSEWLDITEGPITNRGSHATRNKSLSPGTPEVGVLHAFALDSRPS